MNRFQLSTILCLSICLPLTAQQSQSASTSSAPAPAAPTAQAADEAPQMSAASERTLALKNARTVYIDSQTIFLTASTLERALMKNKDWEKLNLNIVSNPSGADLEIEVHRLRFTHIHTYRLTDRKTGIVLGSGRVWALDGVLASGPMAEKIVSVIFAARFPTVTAQKM
ncbi:MAG: hypothetical protein ABR991_03465 [Terracidiphilus sp.]|jgi:hypothetical protein